MGIGETAAKLFYEQGAAVIVFDKTERLNLNGLDPIECVQIDVRRKVEVKNEINSIINKYGGIDILISNVLV